MNESEIINKAKEGYKQEYFELPDNPEFLDQLKEINKEKKKPLFLGWLSKPIPAYSVALASILFMLLFYTFTPKTTELIVQNNPNTLIQYDTIVLRDTVRIENEIKPITKNSAKKLVKNPPKPKRIRNSIPIQTVVNSGEFYFDASQINDQQNLSGSSSGETELAQFLGVSI